MDEAGTSGGAVIGVIGPPLAVDAAREAIGARARIVAIAPDATALADALPGLDAIVDASARVQLDAALIESAPRLRAVSLASTGASHVDEAALAARGIRVRTLREDPELLQDLTPAAELTWALVLACARRLPAAARHVAAGGWERERFPGTMLRGRRLGVIGCGRIGGWVARYGLAFGMEVVAADPAPRAVPDGVILVDLAELVATSDVITVHVHLDATTRGLLDRTLLSTCRPGAIVVSTARGGIVDEAALLDLLRAGRLGGVGLDVLAVEPPAGDPLVAALGELDGLVVTPHVGGFSPDAVRLVTARAAAKALDDLDMP